MEGFAERAEAAGNWFTRTQKFAEITDSTFVTMDYDQDGFMQPGEVYCAVLLLYTKVIGVVGNAQPPSKDAVDELVRQQLASAGAGGMTAIDEELFKAIATLLCRRIAPTLAMEALFKFIIAPAFAVLLVALLDAASVLDMVWNVPGNERSQERAIRNSIFTAIIIPVFIKLLVPIAVKRVNGGESEALLARHPPAPGASSFGEQEDGPEAAAAPTGNPISVESSDAREQQQQQRRQEEQEQEQEQEAQRRRPPPLPTTVARAEWDEVMDPVSQKVYYVNRQTRETTWVKPPPPLGGGGSAWRL